MDRYEEKRTKMRREGQRGGKRGREEESRTIL